MNIHTEYGFQFKKLLHLLSLIDSEMYILPDEFGTVLLTAENRRHKFRMAVHLDEQFFFTSSLFTYKWKRQILLDVFIWLHMLQNVGLKDSVCTSWKEEGIFEVRVKNIQENSIQHDLSITSEIIKKRIKLCNSIQENTCPLVLLATYIIKSPDTDLKYLPELYKEMTISIHDSRLTFSAKNEYSQVSIDMQTVLTYNMFKNQQSSFCNNPFTTNTKLFIECFTSAMEITAKSHFEVHLFSNEIESNIIHTLRLQFNMNQKMCFLTLDI